MARRMLADEMLILSFFSTPIQMEIKGTIKNIFFILPSKKAQQQQQHIITVSDLNQSINRTTPYTLKENKHENRSPTRL